VSADVRAAIDEVAHAEGATTTGIDDVDGLPFPARIGLPGAHQEDNARLAAALGARIGASPRAVQEGIAAVRWPGRLERIGNTLLDAAHNPDGAEALARHLRSLALPPERIALIFGTLADKDWVPMLDTLAPLAATRFYVAPAGASRGGVDPATMRARHSGTIARSVEEALTLADETTGGDPSLIVIAGSLVLVGQARALRLGLPRDPPVAL
jgi:dihydrofolate synthase/folylpolyglutamate synthase